MEEPKHKDEHDNYYSNEKCKCDEKIMVLQLNKVKEVNNIKFTIINSDTQEHL